MEKLILKTRFYLSSTFYNSLLISWACYNIFFFKKNMLVTSYNKEIATYPLNILYSYHLFPNNFYNTSYLFNINIFIEKTITNSLF